MALHIFQPKFHSLSAGNALMKSNSLKILEFSHIFSVHYFCVKGMSKKLAQYLQQILQFQQSWNEDCIQ